jgi:hypothetical protein
VVYFFNMKITSLSGLLVFTILISGTPVSAAGKVPCKFAGVTIPHAQSHRFYSDNLLPAGANCANRVQNRVCNNGTLTGSDKYRFKNCSVAAGAASCTIGSVTLKSGESERFYPDNLLSADKTCQGATKMRTCNNGVLTGDEAYKFKNCAVTAGAASCTIGSVTIKSGDSAPFYLNNLLPADKTCEGVMQMRTCNNGVLTGGEAYKFKSCGVVEGALPCSLGPVTLKSGESARFYSDNVLPANGSCVNKDLMRTCNNGVLSGDSMFKYKNCKVNINLGEYKGFMNSRPFIVTKDISKEDALKNCKQNASANQKSSVRCTWNREMIFERN